MPLVTMAELEMKYLDEYGPDPFLSILQSVKDKEKVDIVLLIGGKANVYPGIYSLDVAIQIGDLIGTMLYIPENRMTVGKEAITSFRPGPLLTDIDCLFYSMKIVKWVIEDVYPKPKKIHPDLMHWYKNNFRKPEMNSLC